MALDLKQNNLLQAVMEILQEPDSDKFKELLQIVLNACMKVEREIALQAAPYERNEERLGYANGFKDKTFHSRVGKLKLSIPQTRGVAFYPQCLEKGLRSERALKVAVAEMYISGVSTRKVERVTQELCGLEISSTQVSKMAKELDEEFNAFRNRLLGNYPYVLFDAIYVKVRHNGTVIDQAILIAYGINEEGKREIIGLSTKLSEAEVHWREFFQSLIKRGLSGVRLITSDDHSGLKAALRKVFPSVKWQRCQFHLCQNAQGYVAKKSMRGEIALAMKRIFNSFSLEEAHSLIRQTVKQFEKTAPEFTSWLEANVEEGLTCYEFPVSHQKKIRTSNGLERVNREIKRRTRVAVLFPNGESALRLITGVLIEIHEEWITGKTYLDMEAFKEHVLDKETRLAS